LNVGGRPDGRTRPKVKGNEEVRGGNDEGRVVVVVVGVRGEEEGEDVVVRVPPSG